MINDLINNCKILVDNKLDQLLPDSDSGYNAAVKAARYSLFSGGKRIRPFILTKFYELCGGTDNNAYNFAAALEMIHTYSLIHDDLPCMDDDDLRRGNPSCHKAFGEDIALLAGDTLLTLAFSAAAATNDIPQERILKAIRILADKAGISGMIGGQVIDVSVEGTLPDMETLLLMYQKKTGCLLEAAAEIGCVLAGADSETIEYASEYAKNLGLAFQIIDDILDSAGDAAILGKPTGSDQKNNKTTFVTLYGIEKSGELAEKYTQNAINALDFFKGDSKTLKELTEYLLNRNN